MTFNEFLRYSEDALLFFVVFTRRGRGISRRSSLGYLSFSGGTPRQPFNALALDAEVFCGSGLPSVDGDDAQFNCKIVHAGLGALADLSFAVDSATGSPISARNYVLRPCVSRFGYGLESGHGYVRLD